MTAKRRKVQPRRKGSTHPAVTRPAPSRVGWWIAGAIVLVVAVAAFVAISASGKDTVSVGAGIEEMRPVQITGASLPPLPKSGPDPAIGLVAPTIAGTSFAGTAVTVKPNVPTLFVLLAHWCQFCQREVPRLVTWNADGGLPAGLQIIGVATGTNSANPNYPPSAWLARERFAWPIVADSANGDAANAMGLTGLPFFVLVDAGGKVVLREIGAVDPTTLATQIAAALG